MAHEMDNPIHALLGVLGSIDIALDELKEVIPFDKMEYLKQKLSRVEFNAKRVSKMVSAVKEFTKPTTGEFSPITLEHIINSFEAIINPQLHHYGINFTLNLPQEPIWLRANKVEIEQVLVNLGTNSVQAIREAPKENKKEITLNAYKKDSEILRIDFSDTGSGIEEKLLEDIFLDFVTTKASSEGTGLGLAISRKIIQRHKGKIWAESEGPGKGATFHIDLPIANDVTEEEKRKFEDAQNEDKKRELI
jgi:two-component system C4-dicarboxylate transport sensor histidine kinase DctB